MAIDRRTFTLGMGAAAGVAVLGQSRAAAQVTSRLPADVLSHVLPELRAAAAQMLQFSAPETGKVDVATLVRGRAMMPVRPRLAAPAVESKAIPSLGGAPDVRIYIINARPDGARPVIVHLHGGGFILGSAAGDLASLQTEARALDCIIVTVEYRLAPEAPFPAPLDDAYAALLWTYRNCAALGGDPRRIAVQGESAGGGLAAMLAIAARDRGEVPLIHQSLIYPMLDDRTGTKLPPFPIGRVAWTGALNQAGWTAFLGRPAGQKAAPDGAVPARTRTVAGLPDTFIGVGAIDLFVEEDLDFARRLIEAGVPTDLQVVPGAYHGFDVAVPQAASSQRFRQAQFAALTRAFALAK